MQRLRFEGRLEPGHGGGAYVQLPDDVVGALGGLRVRVRGSLQGVELHSSTMPTGKGGACLGVHKATRLAAGVEFGQLVAVELEVDEAPRQLELPPELAQALASDARLRAAFDSLSFTRRRELAESIAGAKRAETRSRRLADTLETLGREG